MMNILKKYIRSLIFEDKELLRKWASETSNVYEKVLNQFGIVPIPHGRESSFLGEGMYQRAFEVIWKNKRAVAKFTDSQPDIDATLDLYYMKNEVPSGLRKHIMRVYDYKDDEDTGIAESLLVVEYLVPLPMNLKRDVFAQFLKGDEDPYKKERVESASIKDVIEVLESVIENFTSDGEIVTSSKKGIKNLAEIIRASITFDKEKNKARLNTNSFYKELIELFTRLGVKLSESEFQLLTHEIYKNVVTMVNRATFPSEMQEPEWMKKKTLRHPDKRVRSFMRFLMFLEERGVDWADVHDDNIMMRPKTSDIVLSDPGMFLDIK